MLVVCSLERKYNISINTGNNTLCLMKDDDDVDDVEFVYLIFLSKCIAAWPVQTSNEHDRCVKFILMYRSL